MWVFAVFVAVPLIEIALFIQVGGWLTLWPTLAIVVGTALLGTALVRRQGLQVMQELQRALDELGDPLAPLAHGALILFAGALLLTPGFLTDAVGFALLLPGVRTALLRWIVRHRVHVRVFGATPGRGQGQTREDVIEPEFEDITPDGRPRTPRDRLDHPGDRPRDRPGPRR